jgi:acetoin utilization protein AcuB
LEDNKVVGIVTTNDFFYKILNPLLGIGEGGKRIINQGVGNPEGMQKVLETVRKGDIEIKSFCSLSSSGAGKNDFVLHLNSENIAPVVKRLKEMGIKAEERPHTT